MGAVPPNEAARALRKVSSVSSSELERFFVKMEKFLSAQSDRFLKVKLETRFVQ